MVRELGFRLIWGIGWVVCQTYFAIFHGHKARGTAHLPRQGPAIIACNHQCYLDPPILCICLRQKVWFMAYERYFGVRGFGLLIRILGAFPADPEKAPVSAYRRSLQVLRKGRILGIFPEGTRGVDEGGVAPFHEGTARIALRSGAPIIPATIRGGTRVWHRSWRLPRPGRLAIIFHPPIIPEKKGGRGEAARITAELERQVRRPLGPSSRAFARIDRLYRSPSPPIRVQEILPFVVAGVILASRAAGLEIPLIIGGLLLYALYLIADRYLLRPARGWKFLRDASPLLALAALHPVFSRSVPGMGGGWLPLAAFVGPPGIQAIWSGQRPGLRWVLGTVLVYLGGVVVTIAGWTAAPGWAVVALSLVVFHLAHSAVTRRLQWRGAVALGLFVAGVLTAVWVRDGGMGDLGFVLATGVAAFGLSRLFPSRR